MSLGSANTYKALAVALVIVSWREKLELLQVAKLSLLRSFKAVLVNLFRNRTHFQRLLKNLYTPVFTTQYTEIASMLMEKNKTPVKENIYLYQ